MAVQIIPTQISITATVLGSILVAINKQCIESNFLGFGHFCTFRKSAQKERCTFGLGLWLWLCLTAGYCYTGNVPTFTLIY